jgi:RNA polymerase sigma-70 factor, ECF subfamily
LQELPMTEPERRRPQPSEGTAQEATDSSLLRRLRLGSEDAATQLYLRYAHRLLVLARAQSSPELARRVEAEEIVQSVFGSFFRGVGSGDYDVPEGGELWGLFLVIALNKIRAKGKFHRAAKRDVRRTRGGPDLEEDWEAPGECDAAALGFLRLTVEEAMQRLPAPHRQMVALRIEGYQVAEVAQKTGRSMRTVERILQEARQQLAHLLQED